MIELWNLNHFDFVRHMLLQRFQVEFIGVWIRGRVEKLNWSGNTAQIEVFRLGLQPAFPHWTKVLVL